MSPGWVDGFYVGFAVTLFTVFIAAAFYALGVSRGNK